MNRQCVSAGTSGATTSASSATLRVLKKYWGYPSLRPSQGDVVQACLAGRDTFVAMATGSGKSLCYQLPVMLYREDHGGRGCVSSVDVPVHTVTLFTCLMRDWLSEPCTVWLCVCSHVCRTTVVISPLVSLMEDQVMALTQIGITACHLASTTSYGVCEDAFAGKYAIVYMTPERAESAASKLTQLHATSEIVCIAIDESHCVSDWGHDFRPPFRRLHVLRFVLPNHGRTRNCVLTPHSVPCLRGFLPVCLCLSVCPVTFCLACR